jgi:predicted ferric reductase
VALIFHADADNTVGDGLYPFGTLAEGLGKDLAKIAEILVIALIVLSIVRVLPYGLWKLTHKLMILPYAFSCIHFITAESTFPWFSGWGLWFGGIMAAGLLAYLFRLLWVDLAVSNVRYRVSGLETSSGAFTGIHLSPVGRRRVRARAGQFAFLRSSTSPWAEPHPFSIASSRTDAGLTFFASVSGPWTAALGSSLSVGDEVNVSGPHGNLAVFAGHDRPHIWVAAGSGITPFLSAGDELATLATAPLLIYSFRGAAAIGLDTVRTWRDRGLIHLIEHDSSRQGRLSATSLRTLISGRFADDASRLPVHVAVCGPFELIRVVQRTARRLGIRSLDFETYDYRSGYGPNLAPFTQWVIDRLAAWRKQTR